MNDDARGLSKDSECKDKGTSEYQEEKFSHEGIITSLEDKKKVREDAVQARIHSARHDLGIKSFNTPVRQKTDVEIITTYQNRKDKLKELAYDQLENKLKDRNTCCPKCFGSGENNGKQCPTCQGLGVLSIEADMRAIELVLKPEYPKTSISVNANIDGMTPEQIISLLFTMHNKKNV